MHLEDCRKVSHHGVRHGLEVLDSLGKWAQQRQLASYSHQRLATLETDLRYLDEQLEKLGISIRNDKDMLRQHFQLSSDMTAFRLTLLAGIFLPLSFTTSIFGMNITSPAQEGFEGFSNFTKETLGSLPDEAIRNSSQAVVSSVTTSGPMTYDWATFAKTGLVILATLPLTLTIGWMLRNFVVLSAKYFIYWRMALIVLGVPFALISMFGAFNYRQMGLYAEELYYEWIRGSSKEAKYHDAYSNYSNASVAILCASWGCNGILILCLLGRTYRAWNTKHRRVFWSTVTLATTACFSVEIYGTMTLEITTMFPLMTLPWVLIALGYLIPWLANRRRESIYIANLKRGALEVDSL